mgnify:CR=1 FL=1
MLLLSLRRDDKNGRRVHHNIDPWNRQAWRGSLLLDKTGNVHVVVTRAPSRVRTHRTKDDIVTWVRKLGDIKIGKKIKVPKDVDNLDYAEEWDGLQVRGARIRFYLHPQSDLLSRIVTLHDTRMAATLTPMEERTAAYTKRVKRSQEIHDLRPQLEQTTQSVREKRTAPTATHRRHQH